MKSRLLLPAALTVAMLLACAAAFAARPPIDYPEGPGGPFGDVELSRCATPEPTVAEMNRVQAALKRYVDELGVQAVGGQIKVAFHVIYSGTTGNIPQSQIDAQIAELNKAYAGYYGGVNTGYTFVLASVDRKNSSSWFKMTPGSGAEKNAKNALAIDPAHRLNLYTCKPGQNLLGWAYFPWSYAESNKMHGVVFHYGSVPGGYLSPYNLGGTADHEVGHYLGLYHTFQGGCTDPNDYVSDTPQEGTSTAGCPTNKDTCPAAGADPVHNYMDYSDDVCYTQFTAGQDARMDQMVPTYRPSLLNAAVAQQISGPDADPAGVPSLKGGVAFRGAFPNPFSGQTVLRFALPRAASVSLRVYSITGQLVRNLVDGEQAAGERTVLFEAGDLPAGMYFAVLKVGATQASRSVILVR
ncbi:MAG: T9SS type A sorting domain-containing protein [Candidatus Eisenbacteria bacterium]|nr:T9SS type A sorting domain-containing protein [Candidatus Eisenbacteria bacterium]